MKRELFCSPPSAYEVRSFPRACFRLQCEGFRLARTTLLKTVFATLVATFITASAGDILANVVTIRDPAFGLPHVCADNDLDAARQQGYEDARDRTGQLIMLMRVARGTTYSALGNLGVSPNADIWVRRLNNTSSEFQKMFDAMPADGQALLLAYADGVNTALSEMMRPTPLLEAPLELKFFRQNAVAGSDDLFGNARSLTQGESADPYYAYPHPSYPGSGYQFTPELQVAFAVRMIRTFGEHYWYEAGMADSLEKLIAAYGETKGTELWNDRHWVNDPLAPVSVPDPRNPGFGGPLAKLTPKQRVEVAEAAGRLEDVLLGRTRLPGWPKRDYSAGLEPMRQARRYAEEIARKWGAWPSLGSYAMLVSSGRSATGNPWLGGFPQTDAIQVPPVMHYTEIRGANIKASGMAFVGGPFVLAGRTDNVAWTTTSAWVKTYDAHIEQLVGGDFDLFKYDAHGTTKDISKRIDLVYPPNGAPIEVPVFRTNETCSANGCNKGTRPMMASYGSFQGTVDSATGSSITDAGVTLTPAALVGGHVAIINGKGAGQMRTISGNTADTITVGTPWTTQPNNASEWVAVAVGESITLWVDEATMWMDELEALYSLSLCQQSDSVLDVRAAVRMMPMAINLLAADNQPFNGVGTGSGDGNIYYGTGGFHRVRQRNVIDQRRFVDGTGPEPFAVVSGVVDEAGASSLSDAGAFVGRTFTAAGINFTYDNPDNKGREYIVQITAGDGARQMRRIVSNTNDTLSLEHPWGKIPSAGDTYAVYEIWATAEAMNPAEGFTASWNNKTSRAHDYMSIGIMGGYTGRNQGVEAILEQLSLDASIDREDLRNLNEYVAGVVDHFGTPARYLANRIQQALAAYGDCGTIDDEIIAQNDFPERGRELTNPLLVEPAGLPLAAAAVDGTPDYVMGWATELAADIYGDEYDPAGVSKPNGYTNIGWVVHAIDSAAGDVPGSYEQVYTGDYFNGVDWKKVVRDSFCDYVAANPTIGTKNRTMLDYNHALAGLSCGAGCGTPIEFDATPHGSRSTYSQIVEVGPTIKGEFIFPMGQSAFIAGKPSGFIANLVKQDMLTSALQPIWRDWRFAPMLDVCRDVNFGVDEDGDTDNDGVLDGFERWYYGNLSNGASSDTDGDGASLTTEYRWGSDPTLADTDQDTVPDGSDVAPQDRLCVRGTLKKLSVKDSATAGGDKISAKWEVPLHVCIGSDYATPCATDADCGVAGRCRRVNVDPSRDSLRIVAADDTPLYDQDIPFTSPLWTNKDWVKFQYKDSDAVNGPTAKMKVTLNDRKDVVQLSFSGKGFDVKTPVSAAQGVVGLSIGSRCFMETSTNCTSSSGKLSCKAS